MKKDMVFSALALWSMLPHRFFGGRSRVLFSPDDGAGGTGKEGEGEGKGKKGKEGEGKGKEGEGEEEITFTPAQQKKIDGIVKAARQEGAQKELDKVKAKLDNADLSEAKRKELETQKEELETALSDAKKGATKDKEALSKQHQKDLDAERAKTTLFTDKFKKTEMRRQIDEADKDFILKNRDQIYDMIEAKVQVYPDKDDQLELTGDYIIGLQVEVELDGEDGKGRKKKGKKIVSVYDYIKAKFEGGKDDNLFVSQRVGGSGSRPGGAKGSGKQLTPTELIASGVPDLKVKGRV